MSIGPMDCPCPSVSGMGGGGSGGLRRLRTEVGGECGGDAKGVKMDGSAWKRFDIRFRGMRLRLLLRLVRIRFEGCLGCTLRAGVGVDSEVGTRIVSDRSVVAAVLSAATAVAEDEEGEMGA